MLALFLLNTNSVAKELHHWAKKEYLVSSFVEIALNNEYSVKQSRVRKWTVPIRYYFVHRVADQQLHEQLSKLHLQHLSDITGVDIQPVSKKNKANLLIVFSTEGRLEKELQSEFNIKSKKQRTQLFRNSVCLAHFSINTDHSIRKAIVIIPVDRARAHAKLVACIVEELTQVMGLPNDSEKVFPSIFNDKSTDYLLTGMDYIFLKLLYDVKLMVGMTKKQVEFVLKEMVTELDDNGSLSQAEERVMKAGLYTLLID